MTARKTLKELGEIKSRGISISPVVIEPVKKSEVPFRPPQYL